MKKRGFSMLGIIFVIVIITSTGLITWTIINEKNKPNLTESENNTALETNSLSQENNENIIKTNTTDTNQSSLNTTDTNQFIETNIIPNPTGSITILERSNSNADYFCNGSENPKHKIRLYTYKIIDKIKNLSEEYIESDEKTSVCSFYSNLNMSIGMNYELEWKWTEVENIDGYRIYQYYYKSENISRDFNYYVDFKKETTRLLDTNLNLWQKE